MSRRSLLLVGACWITLLCAAIALSLLAASNDTLAGDRDITHRLQDRPLPGQDLSDTVRAITGTQAVLATGAALCLVLWPRGYWRQAILLGAGLAALAVLQSGLKELVDRPRPTDELVDIRAGFSSPSFPAGHVMSGSYLYAALVYLAVVLPLPRWGAIIVVAYR
jgi:membrane-associated phospholipid phosphatase